LANSLIEIDNRVINEVIEFFKFLDDSEAICGIEFGSRSFNFKSISEVQYCLKRLHKDNICEKKETIHGSFIGVLPHKRMFEFLAETDEHVLSGKINNDIENPANINSILNQPVIINVHVTQVGSSKPKYLLTSISEILDKQTSMK
jgi:hypothetical protein